MARSDVPAALVGAASGLRSQTGLALVTLSAREETLPAPLRHPAVPRLFAALALIEYIVDKLPSTPNRTAPAALLARFGLGAASGALLASSNGRRAVVPTVIAASAAVGAAFGGQAARGVLARRIPPVAAGMVGDLAAIGLALAAVRLTRSGSR
jgi:uncharacterized membrane protein